MKNDGLYIYPNKNLIKNVGYQGTHSFGVKNDFLDKKTYQIKKKLFKIRKTINKKYEIYETSIHVKNFFQETIKQKIKNNIKKYLFINRF